MSHSSLKSAVSVGFQSAKGVNDATLLAFPTLNANISGEQMAQNLPPEVGGSYFSRGAYKAALRSRGEIAFIPRAKAIGFLLGSILHREVVTDNGGVYEHMFTHGDATATPPKWLTVQRMVSNIFGEKILDARVGALRFDIAAANVVNATAQLLGGNYEEVDGADITVGDDPFFITCNTTVTSQAVGLTSQADEFIVDRLSVDIGVQLTDNEFRVGSYYLDDITQLARMVQITADVRIKDRALYSKIYRNNAATPSVAGNGDWSPTIFRGDMNILMRTNEATPKTLEIDLEALDFLTLPIQVTGNELIRAQLTASVTLGADNWNAADLNDPLYQPVTVKLNNDRADAYAHIP